MLESRAAELGRRLRAVSEPHTMSHTMSEWTDDAMPHTMSHTMSQWTDVGYPPPADWMPPEAGTDEPTGVFPVLDPLPPSGTVPIRGATPPPGRMPPRGDAVRDGRTESLVNRGRSNADGARRRWLRGHWRPLAWLAAAACFLGLVVSWVLPGPGAGWPASVARVKAEITAACKNPNVAAEPNQVNFACAKDTQRVLWVFSLLTSGNNPAFSDKVTGRRGLEPIQPSQGGAIAWSLNLHHPYDPANAIDSLQVAARAINNIIGGATLTSSNGAPVVQPGLESSAANCQRYTGSAQLQSRAGFPARCLRPVTSPAGQAALVSDVFKQWMNGATVRDAAEAGVLFSNPDNPGDAQVQAILATLAPASA